METIYSIMDILKINETFFIYLIGFTAMFIIVQKFLFQPYFEQYLKRLEKTEGLIMKAEKIKESNSKKLDEYQRDLIQFNNQFFESLKNKREEIIETHQKLIQEAGSQAKVLIENNKKRFQAQYEEARKQLEKEAPVMAKELSLKILK